jgi:2-beta-glucuronyltransferase
MSNPEKNKSVKSRVVVMSAFHDYRSLKKASLHLTAKALSDEGYEISFISLRYSLLSLLNKDSRNFLWSRANRIESVDGITCFLWRTLFHPFGSKSKLLNICMNIVYRLYSRRLNPQIALLIRSAEFVVVESGVASIFLRRIRKISPTAHIIYYAADRLSTVGSHPFIAKRLSDDANLLDHITVRSERMVDHAILPKNRVNVVGFGIEPDEYHDVGPNPYDSGTHAISVGSMLFDPTFFLQIAPLFPNVQFHVIGAGLKFRDLPNVTQYAEMKFNETLRFIKFASIGLAPYRPAPNAEYLAESSLKMAQYEYYGLPAVCPTFAKGSVFGRFGYEPGDNESMQNAMQDALAHVGKIHPRTFPRWIEIGEEMLRPTSFVSTQS